MSRGHGYVQRFILAELDEQWAIGDPWVHARTLAERLEGSSPTRQTRRSVRRAVRLLASDGLVEIDVGTGARANLKARIAHARIDERALRRARREDAVAWRRQLMPSTSAAGSRVDRR
jgi:DNA-binding FadR family transcriptional regulator